MVRCPRPARRVAGGSVTPSRTRRNDGARRPRLEHVAPQPVRGGEAIETGDRRQDGPPEQVVGEEVRHRRDELRQPGRIGMRLPAGQPPAVRWRRHPPSRAATSGVATVGVAAVAVGAVGLLSPPPSVASPSPSVPSASPSIVTTSESPGSHSVLMSSLVMLMAPTIPRPGRGLLLRDVLSPDGRHPRSAPPRRERLEPQEPVHRLGRRRPQRQGCRRGVAGRRAADRARPAARCPAHVAAAAGDPHRRADALVGGSDVDPGAPLVAAQRAALRRAAGQGQGADARRVRRGAVHAVAPVLRHAAAAARRR